jgi:hypothetical protein
MPKICDMDGVREYGDGLPVELHIDDTSGNLIIVAHNEAGNCGTYVNLNDLLNWVRRGPTDFQVIADGPRTDIERHTTSS